MSDLDILRKIVDDPAKVDAIMRELGGQVIYLPRLDHKSRTVRIQHAYQILTQSGLSRPDAIKRISRDEDVSVRHVRRLTMRGHFCLEMSAPSAENRRNG